MKADEKISALSATHGQAVSVAGGHYRIVPDYFDKNKI